MNPAFERSWVKACVGAPRALDAADLPPRLHRPGTGHPDSVGGLYLTDSYQLHPHDRAISFSTDLGREAARLVLEDG